MKKIRLVTFLILLFAGVSPVFAQYSGFGIRGGLNASNYRNNIFQDGTLYGFHAGVYSTLGITESFGIQPEVLYSQKGIARVNTHNGVHGSYETRRSYIDIPVFLRFNITDGFHFLAGPQVSYLVRGRDRIGEDSRIGTNLDDRWDWGATLGLGYDFMSGLNLGVRYGYGFRTAGHAENMLNWTPRNAVGQVTLGYTFGGRGKVGC